MIRDQQLKEINSTNHTHMMWMVNDICPFKCWYCPEGTWGGNSKTEEHYTWDECSHAVDVICDRYEKGWFLLTGGEPTNWIYYTNLIQKLHNNPNWSAMTITNLSRKLSFIEDYLPYNTSVSCSYHPNVIKTDKQRELWFNKVDAIKNKTLLCIRVMMDPQHWDHCLDVFDKLNDSKLYVEPVRISNYIDGYDINTHDAGVDLEFSYTDEQLYILDRLEPMRGSDYLKKVLGTDPLETTLTYADGVSDKFKSIEAWAALSDLDCAKRTKFKGWHCEIGLNNLYIDPKGDIAKSVCKGARKQMFTSFKNIDNADWPDRPTVCEYEWCFCDPECLISKRKK